MIRAAVINVLLADPIFTGPTKKNLEIPELEENVSDILTTAIKKFRANA